MGQVEIVDFSKQETSYIAQILQSVFEIVDLSAETSGDTINLLEDFIQALEDGSTINIVEDELLLTEEA